MTTKTGTFTGAALSGVLAVFEVPQIIDWSLAGTWTTPGAGIVLQREVGPNAWQTIGGPYTADASGVIYDASQTRFRFRSAITAGSVDYSLADRSATLQEIKDDAGNLVMTHTEAGTVFPTGKKVFYNTLNDGTDDVGATAAELNRAADLSAQAPVVITGTGAITQALHAGKTMTLAEVGGNALVTLTLPAATGTGNKYRFVVDVVNTSNYVFKAVAGADVFRGHVIGNDGGAATTALIWASGATDDTLTLNGTTQGGSARGDWVEFEDIATDHWAVRGVVTQSGNEVTPFSDSVA